MEVFRMEMRHAAAFVGSEVRNQCFTSGETSRFVRVAGTFGSTWLGACPGLDRTYKMTSSRVLG